MIVEVQAWINGSRDYDKGLILYQKFGERAEHRDVVRSVVALLQNSRLEAKLLQKMMNLYTKTIDDSSPIQQPETKTQRQAESASIKTPGKGKIMVPIATPKQKTNHYGNGTANVMSRNGGLRKIHLRLIEKVNGLDVVLGTGGFQQIGYRDMLQLLYSGAKMDMTICTYNSQQKRGGERMELVDCVVSTIKDWFEPSNAKGTTLSASSEKTLADLRQRWIPLFSEMSNIHAKLCATDDATKRFDMAKRIMELQAQCQPYWEAQRHIYEWDCLPDGWQMPKQQDKAKPAATKAELRREIKNLGLSIKRNDAKLLAAPKVGEEAMQLRDRKKEMEQRRDALKKRVAAMP